MSSFVKTCERHLIAQADYFVITRFRGYGRYEPVARADSADEILRILAALKAKEPCTPLLAYAVTETPTGAINTCINPSMHPPRRPKS
jgi:hypothetical protein